ncbi:hypothetical protein PMZ80_000635 [Knufia obscura]|uniref:Uncharacterized protein n=2 Tax=Knufia TaxID=430999 RepID=A0AAN8IHX5_9EURO|nr:hypothetical protein PMZ80_000635 [Knufia obscura]KAK5948517.1 hypothetical protein OHC33_010413 [Knufia fluminis]
MNSKCKTASAPKKSKFKKQERCRIVHRILDGADHDRPCPKCGQTASDIIDEPTTEETVDIAEIAEQESAPPKPSTTKAPLQQQEPHIIIDIEPRCEELVWTIGKLIQEQKTWAALNAKRSR